MAAARLLRLAMVLQALGALGLLPLSRRPWGPGHSARSAQAQDDTLHRALVQRTQEALRHETGPKRDALIRKALNFGLALRDPYCVTIYGSFLRPLSTKLKKQEYHALLNLCATPELVDMGKRIFNDMVDAGHAPQEQSFIFLVRASARMGNPAEAFGVVHRMAQNNVTIRLRTYKPILDELEGLGNFSQFRRVWDHMEAESGVEASEAEVNQALRMLRQDPSLWTAATVAWLEDKLHRFSQLHLGLCEDTLLELEACLAAAKEGNADTNRSGRMERFCPDPRVQECPVCGDEIPRRRLDAEERKDLVEGLMEIAGTSDKLNGEQNLQFFQKWVAKHTADDRGGAYDVIIDAANVAYTRPVNQSTEGFPEPAMGPASALGGAGDEATELESDVEPTSAVASAYPAFTFQQIDAVVTWCKSRGLRPLVVLSMKYTFDTFNTLLLRRGGGGGSQGRYTKSQSTQQLMPADRALLDAWESEDILFNVRGGNDDWYWILGCVTQGEGVDTLFVSNDQLRDHRLRLRHALTFERWQANTQIMFQFVQDPEAPVTATAELRIREPPVWSREIHHGPPRHWHVPGPAEEWACVTLPQPADERTETAEQELARR